MVSEGLSLTFHTKEDENQIFFILATLSAFSTVHVYIIMITVYF